MVDAVSPDASMPGDSVAIRRLGPAANGWGYRPELDGLRTIAVYLVLLFHAGSAKFVGGFIGVDLFFVLSGFLVTNVVLVDLAEHGELRLGRFYARRARRLIPAASLTVIGTALGALLVMNLLDRLHLVDDARAASLWYANWHLLDESNDYFGAGEGETPYLHFWSLAIEEQFYLVFPVFIVAMWRVSRRRVDILFGAVGALLIVGVIVQLRLAQVGQNRAYLGSDARAYQLLAGVALAMALWRWALPEALRSIGRVAAPIALAMLVLAGTRAVDVSVSHRGFIAAGLTGLVIVMLEASRSGPLTSVLACAPIRYLGQISYGTYLWHWPILVLARRVLDMTPFAAFVLSASLGTGLAALSYAIVEGPVRRSDFLRLRPRTTIAFGVFVAVATGLVVAPAVLEIDRKPAVSPLGAAVASSEPDASGSPDGTTSKAPAADTGVSERSRVPELDWAALASKAADVPECRASDGSDCVVVEGSAGVVLIIGDSHAQMFLPALEEIAVRRDLTLAVATSLSCPWPNDAHTGAPDQGRGEVCIEHHQRTYGHIIEALDPDIVVMASYPRTLGTGARLRTTREALQGTPSAELLAILSTDTVDALVAEGRKVVLVEPIPLPAPPRMNQLACLSGATYVDECVNVGLLSEVEERVYRSLAEQSDAVVSLDLDRLICPNLPLCDPIVEGVVVRRDNDHLTPAFAVTLSDEFDRFLVDQGLLPT